MKLVDRTVIDFVESLASGTPTPGGGSVAALMGTMAAALAEMVCNLTLNKEKYSGVQREVAAVKDVCVSYRHRLLELVDEDAIAFDQVMAAFKLPKDQGRIAAIQKGYERAATVPMQTAEQCLGVLQQAAVIARIGNKNSITDAGTAAQMAHAAMHSALLNVQINISAIQDQDFVQKISENMSNMKTSAERLLSEAQSVVSEAL